MPSEPKLVPISAHERFCSDEADAPFQHCLVCDRSLQNAETEYIIEKAYRRNVQYDVDELVFEFALCLSCRETLTERFSDRSLERIDAFYEEHVDAARRTIRLLGADDTDVQPWIDRCMISGTPREELEEYQLMALGRGPWLELGFAPAVIGGSALDELVERISQKTRDESGRFWEEHLGPSPELKKLLDGPPVMV